ncbi:MAG: hypothetical protein GX493_01300 [Firmicutes bacterium]|nr:hypothetical protein [Bacillota bacterium]
MRKTIAAVLVGLLLVVMAALPASAACPLTSLFRKGSSGSCTGGSCLTGLLKNGCSIVQGYTGATGSCNIAKNCGITRLFDLLGKPCGR